MHCPYWILTDCIIIYLPFSQHNHIQNFEEKKLFWHFANLIIPPLPEGGGGILFYLCPSVCLSFRPSKIFFVAFFSATIDGRNLIFGHKLHIGTPYRVKWRGYHKWALAHSSPCFNQIGTSPENKKIWCLWRLKKKILRRKNVNGQSHIIVQQLSCGTRSKVSFVSNPAQISLNYPVN
jgi:hypothetical protein